MVQLKSFRYIESDEFHGQTNERIDETANGNKNVQATRYSPPSSIGGNLTVDHSASSSSSSRLSSSLANEDGNNKQSNEEAQLSTSTLSSNQEYQQARYDLVEDELQADLENSLSSEQQRQALHDSQVIGGGGDGGVQVSADGNTGSSKEARRVLSMSPHAPLKSGRPRVPMARTLESSNLPLANGQPPGSRPLTPKLLSGNLPKASSLGAGGDELSQHSFGLRSGGVSANQFEVRWRNVNLKARKSKLPRFVTDSPLYRVFQKPPEELPEKMYYSPPMMRHKQLMSEASPKVSTISEHLEMSCPPTGSSKTESLADFSSNIQSNTPISARATEYRSILTNISGSVFSGQLTAILGPSGVGKTSLLNSLTGRNTLDGTGRVSLIGGASKRMSVVTVPQMDILPEKLTALEDMRFTSRLKNPARDFDHERNIHRLVQYLQMEKFLNTRIEKLSGGEARRLSIARELLNSPDIMILDEPTSGLDANTCKKIIIALKNIVEHSDHILDRPMSIIITIHQPQREVLNLFHRVYVMAIGGCAIYEGPPSDILTHLLENSSLGQSYQPEQLNENPAIVAIEVASGEYGLDVIRDLSFQHENQCYEESLMNPEEPSNVAAGYSPIANSPISLKMPRSKSPVVASPVPPRFELLHRARMNNNSKYYQESVSLGKPTPILARKPLTHVSSFTSLSYASTYDADLPESTSRLKVDKRLRRSVVMKGDLISHTLTLMSRCWLLTTRDVFLMAVRLIGFILVAVGMLQIFSSALLKEEHVCPVYRSEVEDMQEYMESSRERLLNVKTLLSQSNNTHLFFFYMVLCVITLSSALEGLVFPLRMRMFIREYKNGWYSPAAFTISQTLAEFPIDIIGPSLTVLIVYPLCNQPESPYHWREIGYIILLILTVLMCKNQAQIIGSFLVNSVENSVFISCVMVCPPTLLSGIATRISQMSLPLQYISYASFLRYTFEGLFVIRYGYGLCPCDNEIISGYPTVASSDAIPPNLVSMARGLLDYYQPTVNGTSTKTPVESVQPIDEQDDNIIIRMIRLVTYANNMFVLDPSQLGDCSKYRSLYLIDMGIDDYILPKWIAILIFIFILLRFITYFVIKTVIKLRIR